MVSITIAYRLDLVYGQTIQGQENVMIKHCNAMVKFLGQTF